MTTLQKKYQVFISSTFKDLTTERQKAIQVVVERGHIPIALDHYPALAKKSSEVIKTAVKECQIYIIILGHRYGEIVPGKDVSYTEYEFKDALDLASEGKLKILAFILDQNEINEKRKQLDKNNIEDNKEIHHLSKLEHFHAIVKGDEERIFYKPFHSSDEFSTLVLASLEDVIKDLDIPGWIRETENYDARGVIQSISNNKFILEIVNKLSNFQKLDKRFVESNIEKNAVADFFQTTYHDLLFCPGGKVNLFFESGSTVAYVARDLAEHIKHSLKLDSNGNPNFSIATNNVLAYLNLWLGNKISCTLFPWGPPEENYGATFGPLGDDDIGDPKPDYALPPLNSIAQKEINLLKKLPFSPISWQNTTLLLCAASGLQISKEHLFIQQNLSPTVIEQVNNCYGPHVGSYKNKIFKRFMYDTQLPIVIFLTTQKIDCPIDVGKCHFILDTAFTWESFCNEHPLAFCVGCAQNEIMKYTDKFKLLGFKIIPGSVYDDYTAFIARNERFIADFEKKVGFNV